MRVFVFRFWTKGFIIKWLFSSPVLQLNSSRLSHLLWWRYSTLILMVVSFFTWGSGNERRRFASCWSPNSKSEKYSSSPKLSIFADTIWILPPGKLLCTLVYAYLVFTCQMVLGTCGLFLPHFTMGFYYMVVLCLWEMTANIPGIVCNKARCQTSLLVYTSVVFIWLCYVRFSSLESSNLSPQRSCYCC